jgi:PTH1 family peptidyl-tRNA hydrolase
MNLSGKAVNEVGSFYKIPPERIIVIADDISMEVGRLRIRDKGSDGGHNGLKDILRVLGNQNLLRIKIGVGQKPHPEYDLADWVLSKFQKEDLEKLKPALETVPDALKLLVQGEFSKAQNRFNR